jgi:hypothetical protein
MCCVCFERKSQDELNELPGGQKEDVCKACAESERLTMEPAEFVPGPPTESYQESADRYYWETIGGTRRHPYED